MAGPLERRGFRARMLDGAVRGQIGGAALTSPRGLDLPFAAWALDRLTAYLLEHKGAAMRCSRIDGILSAEGLRWRRHQTWFGKRVDPEFAEKGLRRGALHQPASGRRGGLYQRPGSLTRL